VTTIEKRVGLYRVKVRRKGYLPQTATWASITEGDVFADRHFPSTVSKTRTVSDLIQRSVRDVLPRKSASSRYIQGLQFAWWNKQIGHYPLSHVTPALIAKYPRSRVIPKHNVMMSHRQTS
jgi:hypothetical protein